jgi:hypothetical protein
VRTDTRWWRQIAVLAVVGALVAACGDADGAVGDDPSDDRVVMSQRLARLAAS